MISLAIYLRDCSIDFKIGPSREWIHIHFSPFHSFSVEAFRFVFDICFNPRYWRVQPDEQARSFRWVRLFGPFGIGRRRIHRSCVSV